MRIILTALLSVLVLIPVSASSLWTPIAERMVDAVVFLETLNEDGSPAGFCTGIVIDSAKSHILTAAHCDGHTVLVNGTRSYELFQDSRKDLLVLRASQLTNLPAIVLADSDPSIGEEVASFGYGFAFEKPMFRISHVSISNLDVEGLSGPFFVVDSQYVSGQSGGPVVNSKGELVSIVQRGASGFGFGVGAEVIKDRVGRYFGAKP